MRSFEASFDEALIRCGRIVESLVLYVYGAKCDDALFDSARTAQ